MASLTLALVMAACGRATPKPDPDPDPTLPQVAGVYEGDVAFVSEDPAHTFPTREATVTVTQSDTDVEISVEVTVIEIGDDGEEIGTYRTTSDQIVGTIDMDGVVTIEEVTSSFFGFDECGSYPPESLAASFKDGVLRVEVVGTTPDCGKVTSTLEVEHKLRPV